MKSDTSENLKGIVEADETFVGGAYGKRHKRASYEKPRVVGVIKRGGEVRAQKIPLKGEAQQAKDELAEVISSSLLKYPDVLLY